jgi:hypothetical protein
MSYRYGTITLYGEAFQPTSRSTLVSYCATTCQSHLNAPTTPITQRLTAITRYWFSRSIRPHGQDFFTSPTSPYSLGHRIHPNGRASVTHCSSSNFQSNLRVRNSGAHRGTPRVRFVTQTINQPALRSSAAFACWDATLPADSVAAVLAPPPSGILPPRASFTCVGCSRSPVWLPQWLRS